MAERVQWVDNIIMMTDSYKVSHWRQYPPGTEYVYSYFESRGSDRAGWNECCWFGLQYFIKRYLCGPVVTREKIDEAAALYEEHFGNPDMFNRAGWEYILTAHDGKLPVTIKALPEGMIVPTHTVLMTIVNTDPRCFWLTNFLETLLVQVWYPMSVASNSRFQKITIAEFMERTGCAEMGVDFKLHDFGFRGVSSHESAMIGGAAHLVNFSGTDTVAAMVCAKKYYGATGCPGMSIPASEHSTITSWGPEHEVDAMRNMLEKYPTGLVACVSDSFDVMKACREYWGGTLKEAIKERAAANAAAGGFGRLVVRPDSGDPADTCTEILKILTEKFAEDVTTTSTGHRLLPPYLRVIQGDGVDYESIPKILQRIMDEGFAAENLGFGSGGALLQKLNRDTFKCAFKCSEITVSGETREVFKDPITDKGKASKKGRLTLQLSQETTGFSPEDRYRPRSEDNGVQGGTGFLHYTPDGKYVTVASGRGDPTKDLLTDVFSDGTLLKDWGFAEIRARADIPGGPFTPKAEA